MTNEEIVQALKRCSEMTWKSWKRCTDCPLAEHCREGTLEKFLAGRFADVLKGVKRLKGEKDELLRLVRLFRRDDIQHDPYPKAMTQAEYFGLSEEDEMPAMFKPKLADSLKEYRQKKGEAENADI